MLRGLQVTMDEPDLDSNMDHLCRQRIQQAVNRWHSLNSVCSFCLHIGHYQIIQENNHGSLRQVRSEELPQTMTGKEVVVD